MAGGLSYESWTDAPIGMQAAQADKIIERFRNASSQVGAVMKETPAAPPVAAPSVTNGDRIRSMNDEELAEKLFWAYQVSVEHDCGDISNNWCDMQGGCVGVCDEELSCDEKKVKACILRWLQTPAKEDI